MKDLFVKNNILLKQLGKIQKDYKPSCRKNYLPKNMNSDESVAMWLEKNYEKPSRFH